MVEENCCFLYGEENIQMTKARKYRAMLYLVAVNCGFEKIDAWLTGIGWSETARQIIRRTRP